MFQRIHGIRHVRIRIVKFSTSTTHRAKKRYHQDYLKKNEKSPEWASSRTPGRRKEIKPFTLNIPKAYTEGDGTDPSENGNNLGQIIEAITKEPEFEWWSAFANQSTHITNTPDTEKQKVTYSYLAAQAETRVKAQDIPKAAIEKEMAPDTAVRYILRVNDRRLNLLLPPLDITKAWNLLKPTDITLLNNRLQHIEKLGRNSHIIKASQILYIQKYHLEPPKGRTLQLLENEFKKELEQQNLIETRLILETKTTRGNMTSSTREELTRTHHTFFVYLGLATIEDPKKLAPQVIYRFLKRCKHETLHQSLWDSQKVEFEVENLNALESINDSLKDYIEPCKLNEIVFTSLLRPIILTFNNENLRLPSLPNVREATKFSYLMQVIFGPIAKSSSSDSLAIPHNLLLPPDLNERILRVSDSLDKVGDRLLWVLSQEYFLQRTSLFESLTRSNELLGRLVYLYDFPRVNLQVQESLGEGKNKKELELLGDLFEKFLALMFMTDSKACITWLFGIFDAIQEAIMISLYQKDVQRFTNNAKISSRFKPNAPEVKYQTKEIGQQIERFVSHLTNINTIELRSSKKPKLKIKNPNKKPSV